MATDQFILGVILCLTGAATTNFGLTLQKLSHIRKVAKTLSAQASMQSDEFDEDPASDDSDDAAEVNRINQNLKRQLTFKRMTDEMASIENDEDTCVAAVCRNKMWILGFAIFTAGQILNLIAMGFSSQTLAGTLGSFSLVTNVIFAPCVLKEKITPYMLFSIIIIMAGSGIVVMAMTHKAQDYTLNTLLDLYTRPVFICYAVLVVVVLCYLCYLMRKERLRSLSSKSDTHGDDNRKSNLTDPADENSIARHGVHAEGNGINHNGDETNGNSNDPFTERSKLLVNTHALPLYHTNVEASDEESSENSDSEQSAFVPTFTAAILSSFSVLFGKCTVQLIKTSLACSDCVPVSGMEYHNEFVHPCTYVIIALFAICAGFSVHLLNIGLKLGDALYVVPVYYVSSTVLTIIGGLVYFEEYQQFTITRAIIFAIGVIITLAGIYIATFGQLQTEMQIVDKQVELENEAQAKMPLDIPAHYDHEIIYGLPSARKVSPAKTGRKLTFAADVAEVPSAAAAPVIPVSAPVDAGEHLQRSKHRTYSEPSLYRTITMFATHEPDKSGLTAPRRFSAEAEGSFLPRITATPASKSMRRSFAYVYPSHPLYAHALRSGRALRHRYSVALMGLGIG